MTNGPAASLPDHTGFLLPRPAYNASKPMIISHDQFRIVVLHECVGVAMAESVRSGSVTAVSGIYYNDHRWLQAYLEDLHPPHAELA